MHSWQKAAGFPAALQLSSVSCTEPANFHASYYFAGSVHGNDGNIFEVSAPCIQCAAASSCCKCIIVIEVITSIHICRGLLDPVQCTWHLVTKAAMGHLWPQSGVHC